MTEHELCPASALAIGEARAFDVDGRRICLVRLGRGFRAIADRCSHEDFPLSDGEVDEEEELIECPKHGSLFSLEDGWPICLPATQPVPVYETFEKDGLVFVRLP